MGGDAGDMLKTAAGRAVGALGAIASIRGGGLVNYMMARERMLADPAQRAALINAPFTRGFFGVGTGPAPPAAGAQAQPLAPPGANMPPAGGIAAPSDMRYLPPGGRSYPDLPPLDYETQVKQEQDRANMIGLTSSDPVIRGQSKAAIGAPLSGDEATALVHSGNVLVGQSGPGSQVTYKTGFGGITVGSPYMAGNYMSKEAADEVARRTGQVSVPSNVPGQYKVMPQERLPPGEYRSKAEADAGKQPNEESVLTGRRDVDGTPTWERRKVEPAGVPPLEQRPAVQPAKPAAAKPTPSVPPARATPPPPQPSPADTGAPPSAAAPSPAPAPEGAAPPPPPPQPPPHEVLRMRPDGSFEKVPPAPPPRAAPRAEAAPMVAPPMLAAGAPPLFQFPAQAPGPAPEAAPVMVARAEPPPPYQVVPGAELPGVVSGAPPAPAEQRAVPPPPERPAPAAAVPWQTETPGQAAAALTPPYPGGMPAGTQRVTETRPLPGAEGGTVSYEETTPAGLSFEQQRDLIMRDNEQRFGKIPAAKELAGFMAVRSQINNLLDGYTPEQRAQYLGWVTPYIQRFFEQKDPAYQNFIQNTAMIRDFAIAAGIPERATANFPTGEEHTAADYESRLRGATNMIDKFIAAPTTLDAMHPKDETHANFQKVVDKYLSGPAPVHYGPYPWDEKTGYVIPTETTTTTTSPGPTTTTLYPVDVRRSVQPSR